jgi:hypothetical protein
MASGQLQLHMNMDGARVRLAFILHFAGAISEIFRELNTVACILHGRLLVLNMSQGYLMRGITGQFLRV